MGKTSQKTVALAQQLNSLIARMQTGVAFTEQVDWPEGAGGTRRWKIRRTFRYALPTQVAGTTHSMIAYPVRVTLGEAGLGGSAP